MDIFRQKREQFRNKNVKDAMKSSTSGPDVRGVLLTYLPSTTTNKKAPRKAKFLIITPDVHIPLKNGEEQKITVKQFSRMVVACFGLKDVEVGSVVALGAIYASKYESYTNYTSNNQVVLKSTDYTLPYEAIKLVKFEEMTDTNAIIPIGFHSDKFMSFANEVVDVDAFVHTKEDEDPKLAAWVKNGYPFTVIQDDINIHVSVKLYEESIKSLGISNIEHWKHLAPNLLHSLSGNLIGYFTSDSESLDINKFGDNDDSSNTQYSHGLSFTVQKTNWDNQAIIQSAGIPVDVDFVKKFFDDEPFLESEYSTKNVFSSSKTSLIKNLGEYTGKMKDFYENPSWNFYFLSNFDNFDDSNMDSSTFISKYKDNTLSFRGNNQISTIFAIKSPSLKRNLD